MSVDNHTKVGYKINITFNSIYKISYKFISNHNVYVLALIDCKTIIRVITLLLNFIEQLLQHLVF